VIVLPIVATLAVVAAAYLAFKLRHVPGRLAALRSERDAAATGGADQLRLSQRLVDELAAARQRESRAIELADERRAEAAELRAQLERRAAEVYIGHRVVVQTKDGHTIDGMMAAVYADHYRLESGKYLVGGDSRVLSGDELVPIDNVSWIQRPADRGAEAEGA
jgi:hypothetical protein